MTSPMIATGACSTTVLSPFLLLPIGGQKGILTPTVSAHNRSKRDNCCSTRTLPNSTTIPPWQGLKAGAVIVYSKTIQRNTTGGNKRVTTPRRSKTITFSLPPEMEAQVRRVMKEDALSVSELLRQGIRLFMEERKWRREARHARLR